MTDDRFAVKDATTSRDDMCRTMANGLRALGVDDPNVGPFSHWFVLFTSIGAEVSVIGAAASLANDDLMPDTAGEEGLGRWADVFGAPSQGEGGSVGAVVLESSDVSPVVKGSILRDTAGFRYRVTIGGDYANGDTIPIEALDGGSLTNHEAGDVLQWASAPPYAATNAKVAPGGLINGIDAEGIEAKRGRVLSIFREPPGAGNEEQVCEIAEASAPQVAKAFCYPAALGPATTRCVVCSATTKTSKARTVDPTIVDGLVAPYVRGQLPGHPWIGLTSVTSVAADVAFAISVPNAPNALPPGPGGGWLDGKPWPQPDGVATTRCSVIAVVSSRAFTVDARTIPSPTVTQVSWVSRKDWTVKTALVTKVSGAVGAFAITLDAPFDGIEVGDLIFPAFEQSADVLAAVLAQFEAMGPGELSTNPVVLTRAARFPPPSAGYPSSLGPHLLNRITDDVDDVLAAQFSYREAGGVSAAGSAGAIEPPVPSDMTAPPAIFVPRRLAFYKVP